MRKGLREWHLSRRDLLAAAFAAMVTGLAAGCKKEPAQACKGIRAHQEPVSALAVSPDRALLASGGGDRGSTIKLWSLPDGALFKTLYGHKDWVNSLVVSPDGKLLASGSEDATIKLWSLPEGELLRTLGQEGGQRPGTVRSIRRRSRFCSIMR